MNDIDDYATCAETYVTLRAYHESEDPSTFSAAIFHPDRYSMYRRFS